MSSNRRLVTVAGIGAEVCGDPAADRRVVVTPKRLRPLRQRLVELVLAGLVVALLGLSYGAFAVVALRAARSEGGALHASDFDTAGANPWELPREPQPPPGRTLALTRSQATPMP
ncbi:MAG: hypothetical protein ACLQJR_22510 [Stellaceae bacterium]